MTEKFHLKAHGHTVSLDYSTSIAMLRTESLNSVLKKI